MALNGGVDQLERGFKRGFSTVSRDMYIPSHRHREVWRATLHQEKETSRNNVLARVLTTLKGLAACHPTTDNAGISL
jgi:hypothetical protein